MANPSNMVKLVIRLYFRPKSIWTVRHWNKKAIPNHNIFPSRLLLWQSSRMSLFSVLNSTFKDVPSQYAWKYLRMSLQSMFDSIFKDVPVSPTWICFMRSWILSLISTLDSIPNIGLTTLRLLALFQTHHREEEILLSGWVLCCFLASISDISQVQCHCGCLKFCDFGSPQSRFARSFWQWAWFHSSTLVAQQNDGVANLEHKQVKRNARWVPPSYNLLAGHFWRFLIPCLGPNSLVDIFISL